jgi:hypothetical protein
MKAGFLTTRWNNIFSIVLGLVAVFFVVAVLTGMNVPFAGGGQTSFIVLVVIGGIGCAVNEVQSSLRFRPTKWRWKRHGHPITVVGQILGIFALILIIRTFSGLNTGAITGYTTAFLVLAVVTFILFVLNFGRNALLKS